MLRTHRPTLRVLLGSALLLGASVASAATLKLNTTPYSGTGGVFAVTHSSLDISDYSSAAFFQSTSGANGLGFGTFCLEYNEYFTPGGTYDYTIAGYANSGGLSGQTSPGKDPLSIGTAWLYSQFATGILSGYNYTGTTANQKASALALQQAFWFLEGEGQGNLSNSFVQAAVTKFGSLAGATVNSNGVYGAKVLNITSNGGQTRHQSQLYYNVPETGTVALLFVSAFAALMGLRRKLAAK